MSAVLAVSLCPGDYDPGKYDQENYSQNEQESCIV